MNCPKNEHTPYKYGRNLQVCVIFLTKYLHISQKCCTFASAFAKNTNALLNGVMVALQILVLSVWVRVLVEQQNERDQIWSLFFSAATLCRLIRLPFLFTLSSPASLPAGDNNRPVASVGRDDLAQLFVPHAARR